MHTSISVLLTTAAIAIPVGTALAAGYPTTQKPAVKATPTTIQGPSVNMRWGPVRVTIIVQGKHITDIRTTAPTERPRSAIINNRAIPMLRREVLKAQNAKIDLISGATMTSKAFVTSLQAAITQAHL